MRALIVDDDPAIRTLLGRVVQRQGFTPDYAENGRIAVEQLKQEYDLILLDLMMPLMSGTEVIEYLKTNNPSQLNKTIVLSAANTSTLEKITGTYDVIQKPFDIPALQSKIYQLTTS